MWEGKPSSNNEVLRDKTMGQTHACQIYDLGFVEYLKAMQLQSSLVSARLAGEIPDTILLLQHFPVITMGSSSHEEDIICSQNLLNSKGIPTLRTDRGGGVTYHGPGQLVCYLIFDLRATVKDIHQFVRSLEEILINTLATYSITAHIDFDYPGVWVGQAKICALGMRAKCWVTKHGLALNVNTNLEHFDLIIPCGIRDRRVTSMSKLLGHDVAMEDVTFHLVEQCAEVFKVDLEVKPSAKLESV